MVTTALVIAEVHSLMLRWRGSGDAALFLAVAFNSDAHTVADIDREVIEAAIGRWIRPFADQSFSLCDVVSFEIMRRSRLSRCLTFDRHFAVAGYQILP